MQSQMDTQGKIKSMFPKSCFFVITKYLDLGDILNKMIILNKNIRELFLSEDYRYKLLIQPFLKYINLNEFIKREDILIKSDIMEFLKLNCKIVSLQQAKDLKPYCYLTDGGTYDNDYYYFIQNIFQKGSRCYCTKLPSNVHVQIYLGQEVNVNPIDIPPKKYMINGDIYKIRLPYEKYFANQLSKLIQY